MQTILTTESLRVSFFFFIIIYRTDCYEFPHTCGELLSLLEFRVRISSAHCDQKTVDLIRTVVEGLLAKFRELTVVFVKVARYSFSRSIPPKFECKLRRHKQRFGKIDTTVVLDKDENLL